MIVYILFEWVGDEKIMKGAFWSMAGAEAQRDAEITRWGGSRGYFEIETWEVKD